LSALVDGRLDESDQSFSLVKIDNPGVEVSAMVIDDKQQLVIRLFNAESDRLEHVVSFKNSPKHVEAIELNGPPNRFWIFTQPPADVTEFMSGFLSSDSRR
jgi:hypothetical protein